MNIERILQNLKTFSASFFKNISLALCSKCNLIFPLQVKFFNTNLQIYFLPQWWNLYWLVAEVLFIGTSINNLFTLDFSIWFYWKYGLQLTAVLKLCLNLNPEYALHLLIWKYARKHIAINRFFLWGICRVTTGSHIQHFQKIIICTLILVCNYI